MTINEKALEAATSAVVQENERLREENENLKECIEEMRPYREPELLKEIRAAFENGHDCVQLTLTGTPVEPLIISTNFGDFVDSGDGKTFVRKSPTPPPETNEEK